MSSYAELTLGSLTLGASRNGIDPDLMWLFRPSDKRIDRIDRRNREQLAKYVMDEYIDDYDENNPFTRVEYRCAAVEARDRLDLNGFTYEVSEARFKTGLKDEIQKYEEFLTHSPSYFENLQVLRSLTIKSWLKALGRIREQCLTKEMLGGIPPTDVQLPLLRFMLKPSLEFYGFPGIDYRHFTHFVRLAVEAVPPHEQLVYDLSNLVSSGWVSEADELVAQAEAHINENFLLAKRIIVLTEGDSDRQILKRSLGLLYPHLADYFHFFDFARKRGGGGTGELANLVRAFAAADVRHRILALFDNDTAAKAALSNLDLDSLPNNIAVRHYPDIAMAQDYPTLGPSGEIRMDVNGLAGSIELYLGQDILRDAEGVLSPVQWTGYDRKIRTYQGEIFDKQNILNKFDRKLASCERCPEQIDCYDWEGIRAILETMRTAFHNVGAEAILSGAIYE